MAAWPEASNPQSVCSALPRLAFPLSLARRSSTRLHQCRPWCLVGLPAAKKPRIRCCNSKVGRDAVPRRVLFFPSTLVALPRRRAHRVRMPCRVTASSVGCLLSAGSAMPNVVLLQTRREPFDSLDETKPRDSKAPVARDFHQITSSLLNEPRRRKCSQPSGRGGYRTSCRHIQGNIP
jgi:hypothetical protein